MHSRRRRPWLLASLVLVALRSAPSTLFEQLNFDSDQAIVGLMAKHLADGRHFPLFFYGQHYMLGVQAWIAAPFFLVGGPTIAMLRLPLAIVNVAVVWWLIAGSMRRGVSGAWAIVAALPLAAAGPVAATLLMQTLGASVEPLLYVLILWHARRRPLVFGALFCVGYLHREMTLFALPAVAAVWLLSRPTLDRASAVHAMKAVGAFAIVWLGIACLTQRVSTLGPPGGLISPGSLFGQNQMVMARLSFEPVAYLARLVAVVRVLLPESLRPARGAAVAGGLAQLAREKGRRSDSPVSYV